MDPRDFDSLVRFLTVAANRRGLLGLLAGVPVLGGLVALLPGPAGAARSCAEKCDNKSSKRARLRCRRRCRRQKQQKPKSKPKQKQKSKCRSDEDCPPGTVCANGRCLLGGAVKCNTSHHCHGYGVCDQGVCQLCTVRCGQPPCDGAALQAAIAKGGVVYVCPGRYTGTYVLITDARVIGAGQGDDPEVDTILDGQQQGTVVTIPGGVTARLHGLRIQGGDNVDLGGGVFYEGRVTVTDCTITGNRAVSGEGGGLYGTNSSDLIMSHSTVADNKAVGAGGGIFSEGPANITNCTIAHNEAGEDGGGMYSDGPNLTVTNCTITDNQAQNGGGIFSSSHLLTVTISTITDNIAQNGGGISSGGTVTIDESTFEDNRALAHGGGIALHQQALASINDCTFQVNKATPLGSADIYNEGTLTVTNSGDIDCVNGPDGCGCPGQAPACS